MDSNESVHERHLHASAAKAVGLIQYFPGIFVLRHYKASWLIHDLYAGIVLATMLIPVGIAYAVASGLPGVYGLYATVIPLFAYAIFGPSRVLVLGPDSSLTAIVLTVILTTTAADPSRAIAVASMMALTAGGICLIAGIAKLGFVTELLSKPIRYGYMNGIALTVVISQLPKFLGIDNLSHDPVHGLIQSLSGISLGLNNWISTSIGIFTLTVVLIFRRFSKVPVFLIALVISTSAVILFDLNTRNHVAILGSIPKELPSFSFPWIFQTDWIPVLIGGMAIAFVAMADTSVLSRSLSARNGDLIDQNQELIALGVANIAAGLFKGFAVSSSSSRTPIAVIAGAKTQLAGVVGAFSVGLTLLWSPRFLEYVPQSALAALVMVAGWSLFEVKDLKRIYRIQKWEFWLSIFCLVSVVIFGVISGIVLAIFVAMFEFVWAAWRPHSAILGRVEGMKGYHDLKRYAHAQQIPGLILFRWDAPLFFANVELFNKLLSEAIERSGDVKWVVVASEPITNIDVTASDSLYALNKRLQNLEIRMIFAEMKDPVKDKLKQYEIFGTFGAESFYPTVGSAVKAYLDSHAVQWHDWQDRKDIGQQ